MDRPDREVAGAGRPGHRHVAGDRRRPRWGRPPRPVNRTRADGAVREVATQPVARARVEQPGRAEAVPGRCRCRCGSSRSRRTAACAEDRRSARRTRRDSRPAASCAVTPLASVWPAADVDRARSRACSAGSARRARSRRRRAGHGQIAGHGHGVVRDARSRRPWKVRTLPLDSRLLSPSPMRVSRRRIGRDGLPQSRPVRRPRSRSWSVTVPRAVPGHVQGVRAQPACRPGPSR